MVMNQRVVGSKGQRSGSIKTVWPKEGGDGAEERKTEAEQVWLMLEYR